MKPEHKKYILTNADRESASRIAEQLGIKERKVRKFLAGQKGKNDPPDSVKRTARASDKKSLFLSVFLIAALGFAVYANSLNGEFIWDDQHLVEDNVYIRGWANVPKFFTESMGSGADAADVYSFYRPAQMITYAIDYSFWKRNVRGYHLTNVLLHVLASLMVFWFITALYGDWRLSLFTGLLFAAHPVHTEAVSYISGRADPLFLIFMLLCFVFYIKSLRREKAVYSVGMAVSYLLAVFSKEISLILPFLLLLYHYTFRVKIKLRTILPVLVLNVSYIIARFTFLSFLSSHVVHQTTFAQRLAGFFIAIVHYIKIIVLPLDLHMEYGNSFFDFTYPQAWAGMAAVLALAIALVKTRPARNIVFFSLAWFLLGLFPSSGLAYPINAYMAEHWLYLPSIGIFLLLSKGLTLLSDEKRMKAVSIAAVVLFLGFYAYLTVQQNHYWKAPIPFYERTLKYANNSSRVYFNLGNEYRRAGRNEQAVPLYKKAIGIRPDYRDARYNLAKAHEEMGQNGEAMAAYQEIIESDPDHDKAYYNLGNLYYGSGRYDEAVRAYEKVIVINPGHIKAYNNLGVAYAGIGRKEEAESLFRKAIAVDPENEMAYGNLAILYFGRQKYDLAVEYYEKANELGFVDPKFDKKIAPYLGQTPGLPQ